MSAKGISAAVARFVDSCALVDVLISTVLSSGCCSCSSRDARASEILQLSVVMDPSFVLDKVQVEGLQ
jgi:hypothetical protein